MYLLWVFLACLVALAVLLLVLTLDAAVEHRQRKICTKCGKVKDELITSHAVE